MINYNPKEWFTFIFHFHKADTFRKLFPMLIAIGAYSGLIAYLEVDVFKKICIETGLQIDKELFRKFPNSDLATVSITTFKFRIRFLLIR